MSVTEVRLPAPLFREHEFVVEAKVDGGARDRAVQFQVLTAPPGAAAALNAAGPWADSAAGVSVIQPQSGRLQDRGCHSGPPRPRRTGRTRQDA